MTQWQIHHTSKLKGAASLQVFQGSNESTQEFPPAKELSSFSVAISPSEVSSCNLVLGFRVRETDIERLPNQSSAGIRHFGILAVYFVNFCITIFQDSG